MQVLYLWYLTHTQIQVAGNCLFNKCKVIVNSNHQVEVFMQLLFALQSSSQSVASIIGVHMKEVQVKDTSNSSINTCGKRITPMCGFYLYTQDRETMCFGTTILHFILNSCLLVFSEKIFIRHTFPIILFTETTIQIYCMHKSIQFLTSTKKQV